MLVAYAKLNLTYIICRTLTLYVNIIPITMILRSLCSPLGGRLALILIFSSEIMLREIGKEDNNLRVNYLTLLKDYTYVHTLSYFTHMFFKILFIIMFPYICIYNIFMVIYITFEIFIFFLRLLKIFQILELLENQILFNFLKILSRNMNF